MSFAPGSLVRREDGTFAASFTAMANPCELLVDTDDPAEAEAALRAAADEAHRIEAKFSRYRDDSVVSAIHRLGGRPVVVDDETAHLLDYAETCWRVSGGLFDITSGALRRAWRFDGGECIPDEASIRALLEHVGWHRVTWRDRRLTLPAGMEIDLGGIGKEYAVDRSAERVRAAIGAAFVVNYGGDLFAEGPRRDGAAWRIGIDDPERPGERILYRIDLERGGLATSGDARRFVTWKGKRFGHVLNPRTGWPIEDAPRSVTVVGPTCLEAGTPATFAVLHGAQARDYLEELGIAFRIA